MKKTFTTSILVAVLAMTAITANAKSWRINSDTTKGADFADINAAMNSSEVAAGDTLYLDPGCLLTANQTVSKQVTIVGPGYLRNSAPHQGATISGELIFSAANAKIEGVTMTSNVYIRAQKVTIERCWITGNLFNGSSNYNAQYAIIRQCYITSYVHGNSSTSNQTAYWTIENNIIQSSNSEYPVRNLNNPTIRNNYISSSNKDCCPIRDIQAGLVTNNILINKNNKGWIFYNITDVVINHNVMSNSEDTTYPENIFLDGNDESLVFALQGIYDQRYQLKDDSPAKGYATDGGDCGPYGGTYPYVVSGLPAGHPYYTKANIATRAKDGKINVSLNIKMQNE